MIYVFKNFYYLFVESTTNKVETVKYLVMENKIKLVCEICKTTFEREKREQKRNQKKGRKTYCSRSCSGKGNIKNIPEDKIGNTKFLRKGSFADEFTPFRYHLRQASYRKLEFDLTLKYLKEIWDKQMGICPYTGIKLKNWNYHGNNSVYTASLDRIDSNKGYIKGNVQFISKNINFMKNNISHKETVELCKIISNFWK